MCMMLWRKQQLKAEHKHEVAGRVLPLRVVENHRARRLTLRIEPGGRGLRVTVPPGVGMREVEKFVLRHRAWLEARLHALPDKDRLEPGMKVPIRGKLHRIRHRPESARGLTRTGQDEAGAYIEVYGEAAHIGRRIADFLKREARGELAELVRRHSAILGVKAGPITLRDTKSRWGSCSSSGALSFSWRIMMAPATVIDYLVAHEVAHLKEMNHSAAFWQTCRQLCPRTEEGRDWLKRNGSSLQAIPF